MIPPIVFTGFLKPCSDKMTHMLKVRQDIVQGAALKLTYRS